MKNLFIVLAIVLFAVTPLFASAELVPEPAVIPEGALSQYPLTTWRPEGPTTQAPGPVGNSSFQSERSGCEWYIDGKLSYCYFETRAVMLMLANLK